MFRSLFAKWIVAVAILGCCVAPPASASLLTPAFQGQLETWLGQGPLAFSQIYAAGTGDANFNAGDWHSAVDGNGATFTLMKIPAGTYSVLELVYTGASPTFDLQDDVIIGGYNPRSWDSVSGINFAATDAERTAFVFNLSWNVLMREVLTANDSFNTGGNQTYNNGSLGPNFGSTGYVGYSDIYASFNFSYGQLLAASYGIPLGLNLLGTPGFAYGFPYGRIETYTFQQRQAVNETPEPSTIALAGVLILLLSGMYGWRFQRGSLAPSFRN